MKNNSITRKMISHMSRQSVKSSRMRNVFVMITIILASALLTGILMFAVGQKEQTRKELSHRQQVAYFNLSEKQVKELQQDERIAYQIQMKSGVLSEMDGFDVMPYYVSELSEEIRVGRLKSGRLPDAENEIAVQEALLQKMSVRPAVGSSVDFEFYDGAAETFTVSGILEGGSEAKQFSVFFSKKYADEGSQLRDMPYETYAKLQGAEAMSAGECQEEMYQIGSDIGLERKYAAPSRAFIESLSVDMQSAVLYGVVGGVILLACVLVIYGVFYLSVIGRIHQFGQLRTIGMTRGQIKRFVSCEGGLLFLRAAPAGIIMGALAGYFIIPDGFSIRNTCLVAVLVFVVIYVITHVSVSKPAKLAAKVSPVEALRYVPQDSMKKAAGRKMCRNLTAFGLGVMNFSRNRKKAVITMVSLALGGILFMTAATYMSSFDKKNYARQGDFTDAEFVITIARSAIELNENGMSGIQARKPMDADMVERINALDGVRKVMEYKILGLKFDVPEHDEYGENDEVLLLTEEQIKKAEAYLESGSADYEKLAGGDYILMAGSSTMEEIYGWHLEPGDSLTIHYFNGEEMAEKEMSVLGILKDDFVQEQRGMEGWFVLPEAAAEAMVSYKSLNSKLLVSTEPEKEASAGEELGRLVEAEPELTMEALAERAAVYEESANQLFGAISGLAVFIMAFSILSMMNTLITNVVTRKQELAMLESIGMNQRQTRKMLLGESMLLVAATVGVTMTVGTLCGYSLSHYLYQQGAFYMSFRFPAVFAACYAGVLILVPVVIVLAAMHSFSREALVERLRGVGA